MKVFLTICLSLGFVFSSALAFEVIPKKSITCEEVHQIIAEDGAVYLKGWVGSQFYISDASYCHQLSSKAKYNVVKWPVLFVNVKDGRCKGLYTCREFPK